MYLFIAQILFPLKKNSFVQEVGFKPTIFFNYEPGILPLSRLFFKNNKFGGGVPNLH